MGLSEKDAAPATVALRSKETEEDVSSSSPLPVSSLAGVLGATEQKKATTTTTTPSTIDASSSSAAAASKIENDADDSDLNNASWRGRHDASVGQDPLAAAASAASTMISETAHRAAELTLGAVAPGTTTEDLVRASKEGFFSAFTAARALASSAVAAAAASASEVSAAAANAAAAAASHAVEAARANNNNASSNAPSVDDYSPKDGATVLGAFACELHDEITSSVFPKSLRKVSGALFVTSSSAAFVVSKVQHQALGRVVARAVSSSAAEQALASASAVGAASTDLVGFVGVSLAAEEAYEEAKEAEAAAGLPKAGAEVVFLLSEVAEVRVEEEGDKNKLVISATTTTMSKEGGKRAVFASFGAPSDADEAMALLEHVRGEGKQ